MTVGRERVRERVREIEKRERGGGREIVIERVCEDERE